jgi:hypothetical protein
MQASNTKILGTARVVVKLRLVTREGPEELPKQIEHRLSIRVSSDASSFADWKQAGLSLFLAELLLKPSVKLAYINEEAGTNSPLLDCMMQWLEESRAVVETVTSEGNTASGRFDKLGHYHARILGEAGPCIGARPDQLKSLRAGAVALGKDGLN